MSVSTVRLLRQRVDELETVNRIRRSQRLTMAMPVKHHHRVFASVEAVDVVVIVDADCRHFLE